MLLIYLSLDKKLMRILSISPVKIVVTVLSGQFQNVKAYSEAHILKNSRVYDVHVGQNVEKPLFYHPVELVNLEAPEFRIEILHVFFPDFVVSTVYANRFDYRVFVVIKLKRVIIRTLPT